MVLLPTIVVPAAKQRLGHVLVLVQARRRRRQQRQRLPLELHRLMRPVEEQISISAAQANAAR